MKVQGLNHLCFSVSNLDRSIAFYEHIFGAKLLVKGRKLAYFGLNGLWIALNEERDVPRYDIQPTYTHIAFTINEREFDEMKARLVQYGARLLPGRERDERDKQSIYFADPDGHRFEFHTGQLNDRLNYYKETMPHMTFFDE
ncbi:metallothiol transferase FosB [Paenibacillus alvei]|uniref:Metallothiol transferase FosB n=1 Tax=Paenibacillus alvei TaxID=44250 RepID=A0ABT4GY42_PAEAL|nr:MULTISPECIES: metallothiol transferase FosB [Paenibacillus]MCY7483065.1 metallothiol transferase FosB [Paenibacillus alvei]MCY9761629.1 metallothiol transferase FosB [Paenibacillus alvei]MCY9769670.1 metallothiol transferase FosB [Paenibacillus alvei]